MKNATRRKHRFTRSWPLLVASLSIACEEDPGEATLRITAYGEEFIEDRIPEEVFVDGWSVDFDRFLVAIGEIQADGAPLEGTFVVDLTSPSMGQGHELGELRLAAGDHPRIDYRIAPIARSVVATPIAATEDDVAQLVDVGASLWVEGRAAKDDRTVAFAWAFSTDTRYVDCETAAPLVDGDEAEGQITIHADHLLYDDLDSEDPNVAFDLVASADANGDDQVTAQELQAVDITTEARYQVGSRDVTDLWSFIEVQTRTVGHIDGEGHCEQGDSAPG